MRLRDQREMLKLCDRADGKLGKLGEAAWAGDDDSAYYRLMGELFKAIRDLHACVVRAHLHALDDIDGELARAVELLGRAPARSGSTKKKASRTVNRGSRLSGSQGQLRSEATASESLSAQEGRSSSRDSKHARLRRAR